MRRHTLPACLQVPPRTPPPGPQARPRDHKPERHGRKEQPHRHKRFGGRTRQKRIHNGNSAPENCGRMGQQDQGKSRGKHGFRPVPVLGPERDTGTEKKQARTPNRPATPATPHPHRLHPTTSRRGQTAPPGARRSMAVTDLLRHTHHRQQEPHVQGSQGPKQPQALHICPAPDGTTDRQTEKMPGTHTQDQTHHKFPRGAQNDSAQDNQENQEESNQHHSNHQHRRAGCPGLQPRGGRRGFPPFPNRPSRGNMKL